MYSENTDMRRQKACTDILGEKETGNPFDYTLRWDNFQSPIEAETDFDAHCDLQRDSCGMSKKMQIYRKDCG